jgi:16S rRNA (cytosine1407-C5)-methyltransferase
VLHQGAANVELSLRPGEVIGRHRPAAFDRVLLDAPCSAEGRFCAQEPASFHYWKLSKIHVMARTQRRLLSAGLAALRPGGTLVYATCTFAPEENEAVLQWALEQGRGAVTVEPVRLALRNVLPGLTAWDDQAFDAALARAVRIVPTADMGGFFLARLGKVA